MKYVAPLSESGRMTLRHMHESHPTRRVRIRALALLLSHDGYPMEEVSRIVEVRRQTMSLWIDSWERQGLSGLYDEQRSGHALILTEEDEQFVHSHLHQELRSIKRVIALLEEQRDRQVSESTLRRTLKRVKMKWKRVRKSLKHKRDEQKFQRAKETIEQLETRRAQGEIDLYYFDESGFCLDPVAPYACQPAPQQGSV